jgi:hypothetical protein
LKKLTAAVITAMLLGALLVVAAVRSRGTATLDTPEACLEQMFQAMRSGDAAAYLDCFTGELRGQLERTAREQSTAGFSRYLVESAAPIKGRAVLQHRTLYSGPDQVRLVVDRVYENRPWEYQAYRLRRDGTWKIYAIDPAEPHEPPVPYGTPAFPELDSSEETVKTSRGDG